MLDSGHWPSGTHMVPAGQAASRGPPHEGGMPIHLVPMQTLRSTQAELRPPPQSLSARQACSMG